MFSRGFSLILGLGFSVFAWAEDKPDFPKPSSEIYYEDFLTVEFNDQRNIVKMDNFAPRLMKALANQPILKSVRYFGRNLVCTPSAGYGESCKSKYYAFG